jgi:hypothetical protein
LTEGGPPQRAADSDFPQRLLEWQQRALDDRKLDSLAMFLACRISSAVASPDAWLSSSTLARLMSRAPSAKVSDAIQELTRRGYLEHSQGGYRPRTPNAAAAKTARAPASVVAFPLARRLSFVRKQAARMAELSAAQADTHLRRALNVQATILRGKGVSEREIEEQLRNLETEINRQQWWCVFGFEKPEGDAG